MPFGHEELTVCPIECGDARKRQPAPIGVDTLPEDRLSILARR
jgi:hypothetical protein